MKKIIVSGRESKNPDWMESLSGTGAIENIRTFKIASTRGGLNQHKVDVKGEADWTEITFSDESTWIGQASEISTLLEQDIARGEAKEDEFVLPTFINDGEASRGLFSKLKIEFISFFKTKATNVALRELAFIVDQHFVPIEGVYEISVNFERNELSKIKETDKPYLLLLHGTNSSLEGSFADLTNNGNCWKDIHKHYEGRVIGLEHHTLTKGPLQNTLQLVNMFPENIELHILSHSRGGFIGDILCRFDPLTNKNGFTYEEIDFLRRELAEEFDESVSEDYLKQISLLKKSIFQKNIRVTKFVRVACPASGTSLLSQRLNYFFNVFNNLTRALGTPGGLIASKIGGVILQIIKAKDDPKVLPGLEVMRPESKLNIVLNNPHIRSNGELSVVSSNSNIRGGVLKGLAYVLTRLVFWEDNDFVVNTTAMYNGLRRNSKTRHLFVDDDAITHISYFQNAKVQANIKLELMGKYELSEFVEVSSGVNNRGGLGLAWGRTKDQKINGDADIVIVLPGIMGSALSKEKTKDVIWLDYLELATGGFKELEHKNKLTSVAAIKTSYQTLISELLDANFEVDVAHYDWRLSLEKLGDQLNSRIIELLKKVKDKGHSIKIIAHSMGGLLMKDLMINHRETYQRLSNLSGFKFVMLGTPWNGSLSTLQLLVGQGKIFSALNRLAVFESRSELIKIFSNLQGVLSLLPYENGSEEYKFEDPSVWRSIGGNIEESVGWKPPTTALLKKFGAYKKSANRDYNLRNVIYVAGKADETANNYYFNKKRKPALRFTGTPEGDGSVTWADGIPLGVEMTYYVDASHGDLSLDIRMMRGIVEILNTGRTSQSFFKTTKPAVSALRGSKDITPYPHVLNNPEELTATLMGSVGKSRKPKENRSLLKIKLSCGDLIKSDYPVIVGHIKGPVLMGAEKAVNKVTGGELTRMLHMGLYPNEKYTSEILAKKESSRFQGAIIIGVGEVDNITGHILELTIEKAALKYAMFKRRNGSDKNLFLNLQLSSVLLSSHYGRVQIDTSIESLVKGIQGANEVLENHKLNVRIDELEIIEIYEDKCDHAFLIAHNLADNSHNISIEVDNKITRKPGARIRLPRLPGADWHQRYTVTLEKSNNGKKKKSKNSDFIRGLVFQSDSGLARVERIVDYTNHHTIESIVRDIPDSDWNPRLSKALFEMLIPNDFKSNFKRQPNIQLELDEDTAGYPWEMMITDLDDRKPLSVRSSMVRRFATSNYTRDINFIQKASAFILGNPQGDPTKYPNLPGAQAEAKAVAELLRSRQYEITHDDKLMQRPSEYIIDLLTNEYRIIHISAHGDFDKKSGTSKIITGPNKYDVITTGDLCKMTYTPELAFINCCYLGDINASNERTYQDRHKIAASIGLQLLNHGYKMVVVAGWAVDDGAAKVFAEEFYKNILTDANFGDSVKAARLACYNYDRNKNTWGAYHCYGHPDYTLSDSRKSRVEKPRHLLPVQSKVEIRKFLNKLEFKDVETEKLQTKMEEISGRINNSNFQLDVEILELEALCYAEILNWDKAKDIYELIKKGDSNYTFKSMERFANIMTRAAYQEEDYEGISNGLELIKKLIDFAPTAERYSLRASAHKRYYTLNKNDKYLGLMTDAYRKALDYSTFDSVQQYHYPLISYLIGQFFKTQKRHIHKSVLNKIDGHDSLSSILTHVGEKLSEIHVSNSFWDEIAVVSLYEYWMISSNNIEELSVYDKKIRRVYSQAWKLGGTKLKMATEVDQIDFLIAGLEDLNREDVKVKLISEKIQILEKLKQHLCEELNKTSD